MTATSGDYTQIHRVQEFQKMPTEAAAATQAATQAAPGVAGHPTTAIPPATASSTQSAIALAPTSGVPAHEIPASVNRYADAAINGLAGIQAYLKAALQARDHSEDAAWTDYLAFSRQRREELAAQATADRTAAATTRASANTAVLCGVAGAACTAGSGTVDGDSSQKFLAGSGQGFGSLEKYRTATGQAAADMDKAAGADHGARGSEAETHQGELNKAMQKLDDMFAQVRDAIKEIGVSTAERHRVRV
jgi:hypothetical protein